eukprot:2328258-Prymnesium_polylepis.2
MHGLDVVHRDLKAENLVFSAKARAPHAPSPNLRARAPAPARPLTLAGPRPIVQARRYGGGTGGRRQ